MVTNADIIVDDLARKVAAVSIESAQRLARILELEQQLAEQETDAGDDA